MTALILPQIVLPVGLLAWLALFPASTVLGHLLQTIGVGLFIFALSLVAMWTMPPWWVPWIYGVLWMLTVALHLSRRRLLSFPPMSGRRLQPCCRILSSAPEVDRENEDPRAPDRDFAIAPRVFGV